MAAETEATRGPRGRAGFTLIEVLIAMVILSVGLLALEGLAIGASRRVATANRLTEFTLIATHELETTLEGLRKSPVVNPGDDAWDLPNGTEVANTTSDVAPSASSHFQCPNGPLKNRISW